MKEFEIMVREEKGIGFLAQVKIERDEAMVWPENMGETIFHSVVGSTAEEAITLAKRRLVDLLRDNAFTVKRVEQFSQPN